MGPRRALTGLICRRPVSIRHVASFGDTWNACMSREEAIDIMMYIYIIFIHSIHSLIHSFIHSFIQSFNHSLTHSQIHSRVETCRQAFGSRFRNVLAHTFVVLVLTCPFSRLARSKRPNAIPMAWLGLVLYAGFLPSSLQPAETLHQPNS